MPKKRLVIIDYGVGNLHSVSRASSCCGVDVCVSNDPSEIERADFLLLPGVGAFSDAVESLDRNNVINPLKDAITNGKRVLGICLGMQLLFEKSSEFGASNGLGVLKGNVVPIMDHKLENEVIFKSPNMGWYQVHRLNEGAGLNSSVIDGSHGDFFYFAHSFVVNPSDEQVILASTKAGQVEFPSVVGRENLLGCQFHPEKSGEAGLSFLEQFFAT